METKPHDIKPFYTIMKQEYPGTWNPFWVVEVRVTLTGEVKQRIHAGPFASETTAMQSIPDGKP